MLSCIHIFSDRIQSAGADIFNGSNFCSSQRTHGSDAGAQLLAILVNGTDATERDTASEFGARSSPKCRASTKAAASRDRHRKCDQCYSLLTQSFLRIKICCRTLSVARVHGRKQNAAALRFSPCSQHALLPSPALDSCHPPR